MEESAERTLLENMREIVEKKGENLVPSDFLIPELKWLIQNTALSDEDRKMAELRYVRCKKASEIMAELDWYSTNTFTRHNRAVWAKLVRTARRLVGFHDD